MRIVILLLLLAGPMLVKAQLAAKAIEDNDMNLQTRYEVMKANSQTYEDYKVIKEYILEAFWKITMDSVKAQKRQLALANSKIDSLNTALANSKTELSGHLASVEDLTYSSKHISVLGVPFGKGTFLILVGAVVAGFIALAVMLVGRMKIINAEMKEKMLVAHTITLEFEDYKRKALDKQTKLSRELQNERNKLMELRGQKLL